MSDQMKVKRLEEIRVRLTTYPTNDDNIELLSMCDELIKEVDRLNPPWVKIEDVELVEGEEYLLNDNPAYFITSIGRFGNLKYKAFRKLTLQCHSISGNRSGGAFSMTKEVRDHWGIELTYDTLHPAAKELVTISLRNKQ